jgi:hypothetical protein
MDLVTCFLLRSYLANKIMDGECYFLGRNAVWSGRSSPTFRRNLMPSSSGSNSNSSNDWK